MQSIEVIYSILVTTTLIALLVCFVIYVLVTYKKNHNRFVQELQTINSNFEKELLATQLEIQEQTFQHISQDLHDNIGQIISLTNLSVSNMMDTSDEKVKDRAKHAMGLLARCLDEVRTLSKSLSSENIKNIGLAAAIINELQQIEKTGAFQIYSMLTGKSRCLTEEKELVLFRIFQESINNIIKHSSAETVCVSLHYGESNFHLGITDDGIGFDVDGKLKNCGANCSSGLRNIIRRSMLINASYSITSDNKEGTKINIITPYV
jgi:two-component system, NarL family, sensor kinase